MNEINIVVTDVDGKITGTVGQVLERFVGLSKASDARTPVGESNYYPQVLKMRSRFIFWGEHEDMLVSTLLVELLAMDYGVLQEVPTST